MGLNVYRTIFKKIISSKPSTQRLIHLFICFRIPLLSSLLPLTVPISHIILIRTNSVLSIWNNMGEPSHSYSWKSKLFTIN